MERGRGRAGAGLRMDEEKKDCVEGIELGSWGLSCLFVTVVQLLLCAWLEVSGGAGRTAKGGGGINSQTFTFFSFAFVVLSIDVVAIVSVSSLLFCFHPFAKVWCYVA